MLQVAKAAHARQQLVRRCPMQLFRLKGVTFDDRQVGFGSASEPLKPDACCTCKHVKRTLFLQAILHLARHCEDSCVLLCLTWELKCWSAAVALRCAVLDCSGDA
jgi:hypothetical protein